ncbi:hypothetical protein BDK51DRAFT_49039 [Blyttiomyces helicus]|uniref:Uncharacterized protein n=1 Tax=Blyttiomyces helicus TaxID=388810 RepID=A0A4P9VXM3_9FUNG|nr:hypothetical protein BDK51DRAFT_49039 [Blyttiomyces helicus]|eukprot:RKO84469.1 hypothetical protein BDK51DRAFT_49039 [Blyttiomyces helicus]
MNGATTGPAPKSSHPPQSRILGLRTFRFKRARHSLAPIRADPPKDKHARGVRTLLPRTARVALRIVQTRARQPRKSKKTRKHRTPKQRPEDEPPPESKYETQAALAAHLEKTHAERRGACLQAFPEAVRAGLNLAAEFSAIGQNQAFNGNTPTASTYTDRGGWRRPWRAL